MQFKYFILAITTLCTLTSAALIEGRPQEYANNWEVSIYLGANTPHDTINKVLQAAFDGGAALVSEWLMKFQSSGVPKPKIILLRDMLTRAIPIDHEMMFKVIMTDEAVDKIYEMIESETRLAFLTMGGLYGNFHPRSHCSHW